MNRIRLLAFLVGLLFIIIGLANVLMTGFADSETPTYTSIVLVFIGSGLILSVRKK